MHPLTVIVLGMSVLIVIGVLLPARGMLGPNSLVGIRTRTTRANAVVWRRVHQRALPYVVAGAIACWTVLFAGLLVPALASPTVAGVAGAAALLGLIVGAVAAVRRERAGRVG